MAGIVVIGGGVAGLTAARELSGRGERVTVLEARERLGGRMYTEHPEGAGGSVELGAEFVHGRHPDLWKMAQAAKMTLVECGGEDRYVSKGEPMSSGGSGRILSRMMRLTEGDCTFAEFLEREFAGERWAAERERAVDFVEGFNAADHRRVSVQWVIASERASKRIGGEGQYRTAEGYSRLVEWLERECAERGAEIVRRTARASCHGGRGG